VRLTVELESKKGSVKKGKAEGAMHEDDFGKQGIEQRGKDDLRERVPVSCGGATEDQGQALEKQNVVERKEIMALLQKKAKLNRLSIWGWEAIRAARRRLKMPSSDGRRACPAP